MWLEFPTFTIVNLPEPTRSIPCVHASYLLPGTASKSVAVGRQSAGGPGRPHQSIPVDIGHASEPDPKATQQGLLALSATRGAPGTAPSWSARGIRRSPPAFRRHASRRPAGAVSAGRRDAGPPVSAAAGCSDSRSGGSGRALSGLSCLRAEWAGRRRQAGRAVAAPAAADACRVFLWNTSTLCRLVPCRNIGKCSQRNIGNFSSTLRS